MRRTFNTTTALIASLSLLLPAPGLAQDGQPEAEPILCPDGSEPPCEAPAAEAPDPAPDAAPLEATDEATGPNAAPDAGDQTEIQPTLEPDADVSPEPAADATPEVTAAPTPETAQEPEAAPEPETTPELEPSPEPEAAPEAETAPEQSAEPETGSEPGAISEAVEEPEAAATEPTAPAAQEQTTEPVIPPATAPDEPAQTEAEAPDEAATEAPTPAEAEALDETLAEQIPALSEQPAPETGTAPVAESLSADEASTEATVVEETVTEETARSSAEEFITNLSATESTARERDDDGLSDGQKAVLLGLGALAVGAMLDNNRRVEVNSGDRIVVTNPDGSYQVIKDDNALLRKPGSTVRTETFADGSTRTTVLREDGARIVTLYDPQLRIISRVRVEPDGREYVLIDDSRGADPVDVRSLPPAAPAMSFSGSDDEEALRAALQRETGVARAFSLAQVRQIEPVRALAPVIDVDAITFETGSAAIRPEQARALSRLGRLVQDTIALNPREIFLVEGHTDAVGAEAYNLALSDRRAESVALALTEYFGVPPENLVVQGYGEEFLKVPTQDAERENRRVSLRRITDLLRVTAAN
ncbi:OmpA family protein [Phaeovulum sp. NW3]|uniref:OmpA family protein n=1 Tax=Phaeovulum sp. NW3 TaxID=2934933 RepID=UPI00201FFD9B|nr:OmpA family protein [Phaeovulum sp. NW3]MCL7466822.1 OmpA family protein [Phaeovulum sp. NW3]